MADILIGNPEELSEPKGEPVWGAQLPRLEFKGVGNDLLAALWRALNPNETGAALDGVDLVVWKNQPRDVYPIVFRLPDDLTFRFANLLPPEYATVASKWAAQQGMDREGLDASSAEFLLSRLVDFSRIASSAGKPMLLALYI